MITQYIPSDKAVQCFVFLGYDYKQKKPRPRPGLKKKILPSLNAEIYTLTCRYIESKVRYVTTSLSVKREVRALSTRLHFICRPEVKEMRRCRKQNIIQSWPVVMKASWRANLSCERQFHNYFQKLWSLRKIQPSLRTFMMQVYCECCRCSRSELNFPSLEYNYNPCWTFML